MHSLPYLKRERLQIILKDAGFIDINIEDITERILPMLRRFYQIALVPYQLIKIFGLRKKFMNTTAAVEAYKHHNLGEYVIITARK